MPRQTAFNHVILSALVAGALAGCGIVFPSKPVNRLPRYQATPALTFGDWLIDPVQLQKGDCQLVANTSDVQVTTDGRFSGNLIQIRMKFQMPLVRPPVASLSSYPVTLPLEGADRVFVVQLAYDPTTAAHFLTPDTFLTVRYQPLNEPLQREVNIATRGLVHGLAALGRYCPAP